MHFFRNVAACSLLLLGMLAVVGEGGVARASDAVIVKLAGQTERERQTEQQFRRLLDQYDLSRWTFTRSIVIQEGAVPHSDPVLTLNTRHLQEDRLLLSTYVHEQLHWFVEQHHEQSQAAIRALRRMYPRIPVGYPQGSSDEEGNYWHLLVIYLEYRADQELLGEAKAREVMSFWSGDHYTWLYKEILRDPEKVGRVLKANGLLL